MRRIVTRLNREGAVHSRIFGHRNLQEFNGYVVFSQGGLHVFPIDRQVPRIVAERFAFLLELLFERLADPGKGVGRHRALRNGQLEDSVQLQAFHVEPVVQRQRCFVATLKDKPAHLRLRIQQQSLREQGGVVGGAQEGLVVREDACLLCNLFRKIVFILVPEQAPLVLREIGESFQHGSGNKGKIVAVTGGRGIPVALRSIGTAEIEETRDVFLIAVAELFAIDVQGFLKTRDCLGIVAHIVVVGSEIVEIPRIIGMLVADDFPRDIQRLPIIRIRLPKVAEKRIRDAES